MYGGSTKFLAELKPGDVLANGKKVLGVTYREVPEDVPIQMKEIGKGILVQGEGSPVYIDFLYEVTLDSPGTIPVVDDLENVYEL